MKYKMIALDLDGTLNNDEKVITPRTRDALMAVQEQGVIVCGTGIRSSSTGTAAGG